VAGKGQKASGSRHGRGYHPHLVEVDLGAAEPHGAIRARQMGHHVQRTEVSGYRGEVAAVDVLDDRT
jgi:hypothetical protein